ncbi:MAG: hypothetical protein DME45_06680 [Verrucomicrobia bacterium]|nr:MAG: hypothetical protein DME45_06680 [Verrucomicrobiota bacterium]
MKTLFISITATLLVSNLAFAGAGTLFRDDIGVSNWPLGSSLVTKKEPANRPTTTTAQMGKRPQARNKSKQTDHCVTAR